jgi:hypothetical protein
MLDFRERLILTVPSGVLLALATGFLFGPLGGFHHCYAFGVFTYMLWDEDGPSDPNAPHLFGFDVFISPTRFAASVLAWLFVAGLAAFPLLGPGKQRRPSTHS